MDSRAAPTEVSTSIAHGMDKSVFICSNYIIISTVVGHSTPLRGIERPTTKFYKILLHPLAHPPRFVIYYAPTTKFGCGAVVAQLTVNQLVAGSNPATRAKQISTKRCEF